MQNIHVKRYQSPNGYQGSIEPEDRSWIVFVDDAGKATFWRRAELADIVDAAALGEVGDNHAYYDVEQISELPPA